MLPGRNATKADVRVFLWRGTEIAVKDYGPRPWPVRATLGRWLVRRETAAYRSTAGVAGLPRFLGRLGPHALALEWIDATPLAALPRHRVDASTFAALDRVLDALHGRGVALGDLHHRDVLVGADGSVHVVDLATAWALGPRPGRLRRAIFERLADADRVSAARLRARFCGQSEEEALTAVGTRAQAWHRRGRRAKRLWDRLRGAGA